ncbi:YIF1-domain-containing protein [Polychytrium aggregatum]|uniref:YIF1-domain-containing protein n=1 Tax=Polychytrium aggregatum TaxID=110093 RepID=UPI0022FF3DED|nr:YIF1-domain-containing protein [Polychytrium aggregatum]KAI9204427.1 YIF1-domain-containing protein [Polychytrium aggregatum]
MSRQPPQPSWSPPPLAMPVAQHTSKFKGSLSGTPSPRLQNTTPPQGYAASSSGQQPSLHQRHGQGQTYHHHTQQQQEQQQHQQHQQQYQASGYQGGYQAQGYHSYPDAYQSQPSSGYYAAEPSSPDTSNPFAYSQSTQQASAPSTFSGGYQRVDHQSQSQQQHQHQPQASFFSTDSFFPDNPTAQIGVQFGKSALEHGSKVVSQNINRYVNVSQMKYYWDVSNTYVLQKLSILVFPFRHKSWARQRITDGQTEAFQTPRYDVNAPDLYIPVMSFVTYILLAYIHLGTGTNSKDFSPDLLGRTATSALSTIGAEIVFIKLGCYFLNILAETPLLDLTSYCGYKFVSLIIVQLVKFALPGWIVYSIFTYLMICFGFFTLRSMKGMLLPDASTGTVASAAKQRRYYFLFAVALVQILMSLILIR